MAENMHLSQFQRLIPLTVVASSRLSMIEKIGIILSLTEH